MSLIDRHGRALGSLRVSVTDRCNLRCSYCMPEPEYVWLPREHILTFDEVARLVGVFTALGVRRVRLTGGEPLLRRDLPKLVRLLAANPAIEDLALTTNGVLLAEQAEALRDAGLDRVTVSLDTLDRERFVRLARFDELARVREGMARARQVFPGFKIDMVVIRGENDDEMDAMLDASRVWGAELRFIEYMDVGGATRWSADAVVSRAEMLDRLSRRHGPIEPLADDSPAPADRYRLGDGTVFGIISSTTQPFCRSCDRSRLTADGLWLLCLYAREGTDLRALVRSGAPDEAIARVLAETWMGRTDRGAEARLQERERAALIPADTLRRDPHLEMHTRGG